MTIRHTIEAFTEPITALPTDPQLAPEELKRRLQAPAEELRAAHNALAKEVGGIADATYPDTVTREMLTPEVKQEIAAKAEQSALASEAAARESADSDQNAAIARKCEVFVGRYTGDGLGKTKTVKLGFRPKAIIVANKLTRGNYLKPQDVNFAIDGVPSPCVTITDTGFTVTGYFNGTDSDFGDLNPFRYIAFK